MKHHYDTVDADEATALAFTLAEAAEKPGDGGVRKDDDGTVHTSYLVRRGDRLYQRGEPWAWYDLSADGAPRTDYDDEQAPDDFHFTEARQVKHQDAPMQTYHGWVEASDGWVLLSTDGTSWNPEAYVPNGEDG